jgi:NAD(P)H-flavin reductase/hemoglobin-like flavoprotein
VVDVERLKSSWAQVAGFGDQVPLRFYSRLFIAHPETREMFPLSMAAQRDKLVSALGHTVSHVDDLDELLPFVQQLGRDHRKFGVVPEHYAPVGEALLATLADFLGSEWTEQLAQDWVEAYGLVAKVMIEAAEKAAQDTPPWWEAEVVAHERRSFDLAVLTIQPKPAFDYVPGQSMAVETALRPRVWRYYSPANAPRSDGTIDLHIRREPGGQVSSALVDGIRVGDVLRMGSPVGDGLTLDPTSRRDLLLIAGGTGLAPLKALVEQVAEATEAGEPARRVTLFVGARMDRDLYDMESLRTLEAGSSWLTVVPAVAGTPLEPDRHDPVVEVALRHDDWADHDICVCGSDAMVAATVERLQQAGYPAERIYREGFLGLDGKTYGVPDLGEGDQR